MPALPVSQHVPQTRFQLTGQLGEYLQNITAQWLAIAPHANPGMIEMLRDRDRTPYRDLVPWAGEFFGKYLTGATQVMRLTHDEKLKQYIADFVAELLTHQAEDGYLGPWPDFARATNRVNYPSGRIQWTWDTWSHYHAMLGLMLWHEETGDKKAFAAAQKIADMLCKKYLGNKTPRLVETGSTEMNLAPIHSLAILHRKTGAPKYLQLARQICDDFAARGSDGGYFTGDYLLGSLAGKEFFELPRPRWESLHPIMGMIELYYATGDVKYRDACIQIWKSIARGDRHNNGGFSSGEQATGNPFDHAPIETCCTIAWMALSVEVLHMTGDPAVADELELAMLNSITGMHSPSGRWATYNTPMNGVKIASAQAIVFQAREGTPELNCCSVNSARGFGMLSDFAVTRGENDTLFVNYYGPGTLTTPLNKKTTVSLTQTTQYPFEPKVSLAVNPNIAGEFTLQLRIPRWSRKTGVKVNGNAIKSAKAGTYLAIKRHWKKGDRIELTFDFSLHYWTGRWDCEGKISIYRGPVLLAYDRRYNDMDPDKVPAIAIGKSQPRKATWKAWLPPKLLLEFEAVDGTKVRLCDFGSAGQGGTPYLTWLPGAGEAGAGESGLFEPFAPSADEYRLLGLLRYRSKHEQFLKQIDHLRAGSSWVTRGQVLSTAERLKGVWAAFPAEVQSARDWLAANPDASLAPAVRGALERLDKELGFFKPGFEQNIASLPTAVRREFSMPIACDTFECSVLQPFDAPIGKATLPGEKVTFSPVKTVTDEKFADLRSFHGGNQGLLYVKTKIQSANAGEGVLVYGADGPFRIWHNGELVGTHAEATNPARADAYRATVTMREGVNEVVLALSSANGRAWGVFVGHM